MPFIDTGHSFLQACSRPVIQALAYIWHTEALDGLDDHFGNCARFSSINKATWDTKITLLYWTLKPRPADDQYRDESNKRIFRAFKRPSRNSDAEGFPTTAVCPDLDLDLDNEGRTHSTQFPPDYLGQKKAPRVHGATTPAHHHPEPQAFLRAQHHVEDRATTIVVSSNGLGDFAKCTVISRVISDEEMRSFGRSAEEIRRAFVQQPQTTRCLVFLLLLGLTCDNLAKKYDGILEVLNKELGLSVKSPSALISPSGRVY